MNPPSPTDQAEADAQYYRGVLHELVALGMELARAVQAQAVAKPSPALVAAFDGLARTVRRTVALARKVAEPVPPARAVARRQVIRGVEDAIQRERDGAEAAALGAELAERMDRPELEEEIGTRPVAEIVAEICRDLGLLAPPDTHPWKRRSPAAVAALCAMAARAPVRWAGPPGGATGRPAGPSG